MVGETEGYFDVQTFVFVIYLTKFEDTCDFVRKIIDVLTKKQISDILDVYIGMGLSDNKKRLLSGFLLSKIQLMEEVYFGKEC